ncbi:hypothetical protein EYC59_05525 [Candidatus Saccharibacteria bacterium]|nr:MAG: hypothetical protein EYC59_05525 [Candidatus Saccharibacteria bacterium]
MKLLAAIKYTLVLLAVVLLNSISVAGHTSAMTTMSHEMSGMSHDSSGASSCATLCRTAVINKEENIINNDVNDDDTEPTTPLYFSGRQLSTDDKSVSQRLYAAEVKPPPKIPIYILYGVFRT